MNNHIGHSLKRAVAGLLCAAVGLAAMPAAAERLVDRYEVLFEGEAAIYETRPSYAKVLAQRQNEGFSLAQTDVPVELEPSAFEGEAPERRTQDGREGLLLDEGTSSVSFDVDIPADGLFEMEIVYYPYEGSGQSIRRTLSLDGEIPFSEAENLCLYRRYAYVGEPRYNGFGDQLTYAQGEVRDWFTAQWQDVEGKYASPLLWAMSAGTHTLTLSYIDQPILIASMTLKAPSPLPDYASVAAGYPDVSANTAPLKLQAEQPENILYRTDSTINTYADTDPATEPASDAVKRMNAMGGSAWGSGNQEIVYRFTVAETGLYKLAFRVQQPWNNGMNSYRQILLDGQVPFSELSEYAFPYSRSWYTEVLSDGEGQPYLFYLEGGQEHTLTVRGVMSSQLTGAIGQVREINDVLSTLYRKILLITSAEPDANYDYDLELSIPDLIDTFDTLMEQLDDTAALITGASQSRPASVSNLHMIHRQIQEMRDDPDRIPGRLEDITNSLTTLGNMISSLQSTPLGIDELVFYPASAQVEQRRSSLWQKIGSALRGFLISFQRDYTSVSVSGADVESTIDVWVSRGAEWAAVMERLIQGDFESSHGVGVNLNVLPSGTLASTVNPLLLAITSGDGPDVVLNVEANTTVEYGVRGMAYNLRNFGDYAQVNARFHPEIDKAFTFLGKTYALPETMNFYLMIYRKDILSELSLAVPDTWDEVYYQTLPVLYQNGMAMLAANLDTYLFQNGGSYYTDDGLDTALDSAAAHKAFASTIAQYLDLGFPITANLFSRFRTGEMPIAFVDYGTYLQILTAAPELDGKWGVAPVPGTLQEDGTVNHAVAGLAGSADMLLSTAEDPDACWTFLKWWTDAETQTSYGLELESLLGASARLNTANLEAFSRLPWSRDTLSVIRQYWENARVVPNVLGGVITTRAVNNATNRALYEGKTPREALEEAVKAIRDELKRKQNLYEIGPAVQ